MAGKLISLALILASCPLWAVDDAGTGDLFNAGFGPRAAAIGGANVALEADASGIAANPAALDSGGQPSVGALHAASPFGPAVDYLGLHVPTVDYGGFGLGYFHTGISGIPYRDQHGIADPSKDLGFDASEFLGGYGKEVWPGLSLGAAARLQVQFMGSQQAAGAGLDAGLFYEPRLEGLLGQGWGAFLRRLRVGAQGVNLVAPQLKLGSGQADRLSPVERLGASFQLAPEKSVWEGRILAQFEKEELRAAGFAVGAEFRIMGTVALRAGINPQGLAFGGGLSAYGVDLDYAYATSDLGGLSRFGLAYRWGKAASVLREEASRAREEQIKQRIAREIEPAVEKARQIVLDLSEAEKKKALQDEAFKSLQYVQGIEALNSGRFAEAVSAFEAVYQVDPNYLKIRYYQSQARARASSTESWGMKGAALDMYRQGIASFLRGEYQEAINQWVKILEKDPGNKLALKNIEEAKRRLDSGGGK